MDKLISVINDNLRSIISGIKINASDIETNLKETSTKMDELVIVAGEYKEEVEQSRKNIEQLESEITGLEKDLDELQSKFSGPNFSELLAAGNKEISNQIIQRRASISKESDKILDLTDKAHKLREDLLHLKEQKSLFETDLENAIIVRKYYEERLNDVIDYAAEHSTELEKYIEEKPSEELMTDGELDNEVMGTSVDGSVFEEIDELSVTEPSLDMIEQVMHQTTNEEPTLDKIDVSMTQQLDDIIASANSALKETEDLREYNESLLAKANETDSKIIDLNETEDETDGDKSGINLNLEEIENQANAVENDLDDDFSLEALFKDDQEEDFAETNASEFEIDPFDFNRPKEESGDLTTILSKYGLEEDKIKDIDIIKENINLDDLSNLLDVLSRHGIKMDVLYDNLSSTLTITSQNLDKILSILESTGARVEDIEIAFNVLDKVDMTELERASYDTEDVNLSNILFNSIKATADDEIVKILGLDPIETGVLKSNTKDKEYERMCIFAPLVSKNFETLSSYNIDNVKECFVKHPHRFLINNSTFAEILDKYDPEDLVRCFNKNLAVIDRL